MKSRALPILNAIGCLALTGVVLAQWRKERADVSQIQQLRTELTDSKTQLAEETKRSTAFQKDIEVLKESIALLQSSSEAASRSIAEHDTATRTLQDELTAARDQIKTWEAAITTRDEKLRELNTELTATRARLDEAIAKLKAAGAR